MSTFILVLGIVILGAFVFTWFNLSYNYFRNYGRNSKLYAIWSAVVWVVLIPVLVPASLATLLFKAQN